MNYNAINESVGNIMNPPFDQTKLQEQLIVANGQLAIANALRGENARRDLGDLFNGVIQGGYHGADKFRNTWRIFGYPDSLNFYNYWNMYLRGGVAYSCVTKPVVKRWSSYPKVYDEPYEEDGVIVKRQPTEYEQAVQRLVDEFDLWGVLQEFDEYQRIGLYGAILIIAKEKERVDDLKSTPLLTDGIDSLVSLTPKYETQIDMSDADYDEDMQSSRFGLPTWYRYRDGSNVVGSSMGNNVSIDKEIHWSRAFVFSEFACGNGIVGRPALQPVFNSLMDWYKTIGSASEGHYKNAKQRTQMNVTDPQLAAKMFSSDPANAESQTQYDRMMTEWAAGFNNNLDTAGIEAKVLQAAIADPTGPANLALQDITAGMGIPKTELIGFETGERSSVENANSWNVSNQSWRTTKGTKLVTRFLNHLTDVGILPRPKSGRILVDWPDIAASSIEKRIDNAGGLAQLITALNAANQESAVTAIAEDLLPDVLDIQIDKMVPDRPSSE